MLDMGFIPDIERICKMIPFTRQTLFFTATMPPEIRRITEPSCITPKRSKFRDPRRQPWAWPSSRSAWAASRMRSATRCAACCATPRTSRRDHLLQPQAAKSRCCTNPLQKHGFSVGALHGDMDQSARTAALDQFRKGEISAAGGIGRRGRGLDIPTTSHVFNFDVPHHADDYVHRIAAPGVRARRHAISIVTPLDQKKSMVADRKTESANHSRFEGSVESSGDGPAAFSETERRANAQQKVHARLARRPQAAPGARPRRFGGNGGGRNSSRNRTAPVAAFTPPGPASGLAHAFDRRAETPQARAIRRIGACRSVASPGVPVAPSSSPHLAPTMLICESLAAHASRRSRRSLLSMRLLCSTS